MPIWAEVFACYKTFKTVNDYVPYELAPVCYKNLYNRNFLMFLMS